MFQGMFILMELGLTILAVKQNLKTRMSYRFRG